MQDTLFDGDVKEEVRKRSPSGGAQDCSVPPQHGRRTKWPPEPVPQSLCRDEISPAALCMGGRRSEKELYSHTICKTARGWAPHWLAEAQCSEVCPLAESSTVQDQPLLLSWARLYRHVWIPGLEEWGKWLSQRLTSCMVFAVTG